MKTLQDFLELCRSPIAESTDIYEIFYHSSGELRDLIYEEAIRLGVNLDHEMEPARASMIAIGEYYNIQVLIDY